MRASSALSAAAPIALPSGRCSPARAVAAPDTAASCTTPVAPAWAVGAACSIDGRSSLALCRPCPAAAPPPAPPCGVAPVGVLPAWAILWGTSLELCWAAADVACWVVARPRSKFEISLANLSRSRNTLCKTPCEISVLSRCGRAGGHRPVPSSHKVCSLLLQRVPTNARLPQSPGRCGVARSLHA